MWETFGRDLVVAFVVTAMAVVGLLALAIMMASRFEEEWDDVHKDRRDDCCGDEAEKKEEWELGPFATSDTKDYLHVDENGFKSRVDYTPWNEPE